MNEEVFPQCIMMTMALAGRDETLDQALDGNFGSSA